MVAAVVDDGVASRSVKQSGGVVDATKNDCESFVMGAASTLSCSVKGSEPDYATTLDVSVEIHLDILSVCCCSHMVALCVTYEAMSSVQGESMFSASVQQVKGVFPYTCIVMTVDSDVSECTHVIVCCPTVENGNFIQRGDGCFICDEAVEMACVGVRSAGADDVDELYPVPLSHLQVDFIHEYTHDGLRSNDVFHAMTYCAVSDGIGYGAPVSTAVPVWVCVEGSGS